ncbi:aldolase [Prochlorococcus marinus XMU1414]|uniref:HpcH/HpaI aldolase/citrate lyase domain-containing protein n=1 Tax=Prochlorococcus marinus XMU1424 TaxID=2774497 RepID=A0A9D9G1V6_PROMR|nr:aldolase/citrate lyase family protein [Prochlorococcus marinus]MBO8228670.1 aldolase [Prochlorococcus marinus XMU1414]MBW3046149.1 aldolase [Prochlorococcus marinus str. MU1414]MCR8531559.1 aldolase/citrate lyase family protein [Prochlorococcus marinus XMU1420]MCR8535288.1 aldolase/citrate lyase family protein [Prochlorococcus marinus XMU1424]
MKKLYTYIIPNNTHFGVEADTNGVDSIFIDLEYMGKDERQGHLNTHKAAHQLDDISSYSKNPLKGELLVRINPIWDGSKYEIDQVISRGAERIMLPMAREVNEIEQFKSFVSDRVPVVLLLETKNIIENISSLIGLLGKEDRIHFGLNDLSIDFNFKFLFEILSNNILQNPCEILQKNGIDFGIGGIGRIGSGILDPKLILNEYTRLGSSWVILSRAFHCNLKSFKSLKPHYDELQIFYKNALNLGDEELNLSREKLIEKVNDICKNK